MYICRTRKIFYTVVFGRIAGDCCHPLTMKRNGGKFNSLPPGGETNKSFFFVVTKCLLHHERPKSNMQSNLGVMVYLYPYPS